MPNQSAEHNALMTEVLKRYGREPDLTIWRNSKVRMVRGVPMAMPGLCVGASDIVGVLEVNGEGRFVAFEAKTGSGQLSPRQRMFLALVRMRGGFACVFRSVEEFGAALERARRGERE